MRLIWTTLIFTALKFQVVDVVKSSRQKRFISSDKYEVTAEIDPSSGSGMKAGCIGKQKQDYEEILELFLEDGKGHRELAKLEMDIEGYRSLSENGKIDLRFWPEECVSALLSELKLPSDPRPFNADGEVETDENSFWDLGNVFGCNCLIAGPPGKPGIPGPPGPPGFQGQNGKNGTDGIDGQPGKNGLKGVRGSPGVKGEKGERGDPGEKGRKGATGQQGQPGRNGRKGVPGLNSMVASTRNKMSPVPSSNRTGQVVKIPLALSVLL